MSLQRVARLFFDAAKTELQKEENTWLRSQLGDPRLSENEEPLRATLFFSILNASNSVPEKPKSLPKSKLKKADILIDVFDFKSIGIINSVF